MTQPATQISDRREPADATVTEQLALNRSIVAAAESEDADLIVVGTRGLDRTGRFLLGSISDYVVYHSNCPVLVAHPYPVS